MNTSNIDKSLKLYNANKEYIFEATKFNDAIFEKGDGNYIFDIDGNKYLDLNSGQFCLCFGHNDKKLIKIVSNQLSKIYHTNTSILTTEVIDACKDIASITGGNLKKTIFLSTGSEANECALRYARFITKKSSIISFEKGYHGLTLGSQYASMGGTWARPIKKEYNYYLDYSDCENLEEKFNDIIKKSKNDIAAVIVEPILAVAGIYLPEKEYFQKLRKLCDENNIILIFDECQTGFGRTGKWFCYQHYGIEPDILVCAKSMGMGLAVSSVTFKTEIAKQIEGKIVHFSSHQNDPLNCSIVSYVINRIKNENIMQNIENLGKYLFTKLTSIAKKYDIISLPRGKGFLLGFDFLDSAIEKNPNLPKEFLTILQSNGVLLQAIRRGRTCRLSPSYITSKDEIDFIVDAIERTIMQIAENELNNG